MIFVDSNIPMYLVGAPHPNKQSAQRLLEQAIVDREALVTDAEVFQEILHHYTAIKRPDAIQPAFAALLSVVDEVFAVELRDVERAKQILFGSPGVTARDAVHLATMERHDIRRVMTFDAAFAEFPGVSRFG